MHRGFKVEFLSDATGTLDLENAAGKVYATARQYQATLVTSDTHFESLPQVLFYPKT